MNSKNEFSMSNNWIVNTYNERLKKSSEFINISKKATAESINNDKYLKNKSINKTNIMMNTLKRKRDISWQEWDDKYLKDKRCKMDDIINSYNSTNASTTTLHRNAILS